MGMDRLRNARGYILSTCLLSYSCSSDSSIISIRPQGLAALRGGYFIFMPRAVAALYELSTYNHNG